MAGTGHLSSLRDFRFRRFVSIPAMNRWAIVYRPRGTRRNDRDESPQDQTALSSQRDSADERCGFGDLCPEDRPIIAHQFIGGIDELRQDQSPLGTIDVLMRRHTVTHPVSSHVFRPYGTLGSEGLSQPSDETLGYCLSSLRD